MAVCNVQDLLSDAPCFAAYPDRVQRVIEVQMLCNLLDKLLNGGAVTCDPQTLITQAECFDGLPDYLLQTVKLQLLCEISNAV